MTRWKPDAPGRLRGAALELFEERGYDATTVAAIAERAGLTERTFFRHFSDKREVLFAGSEVLLDALVDALGAAPAGAPALAVVGMALPAAGELFDREFASRRLAVLLASPELEERELVKLARLADALAAGLRERGTPEPAASLAAQAGIAAFRVAFSRWVDDPAQRPFSEHVAAALAELRELATLL